MTKEVGQFEVTEKGIERVIALHDFGGYSIELVIPKDIFVEAYQRYIKTQPKTGWRIAHGMYEDRFWCSCGYIKIIDSDVSEWKYCPVCGGTKMVEPQESD